MCGSTTDIQARLNVINTDDGDGEEKKGPTSSLFFIVNFNSEILYPANLYQRLIPLKQFDSSTDNSDRIIKFTAEEIIGKFNELTYFTASESNLSSSEKLALEEYKLALMRAVYRRLYGEVEDLDQPAKLSRKEKFIKNAKQNGRLLLRWIALILFLAILLSPMVIAGFAYTNIVLVNLLPYIPFAMPSVILKLTGFSFAVSSLIGTIWSIIPNDIMKWIGITASSKNESLFEVYQKQLEITRDINQTLLIPNNMSIEQYAAYTRIAAQFNIHMGSVQDTISKPKQSFFQKITSMVTIGGVVIQALGASIYFAGWIIGLCTGTSLSLFALATSMPLVVAAIAIVPFAAACIGIYRARHSSFFNIAKSEDVQYEALQKKFEHFHTIKPAEFQKLCNTKRIKKEYDALQEEFKHSDPDKKEHDALQEEFKHSHADKKEPADFQMFCREKKEEAEEAGRESHKEKFATTLKSIHKFHSFPLLPLRPVPERKKNYFDSPQIEINLSNSKDITCGTRRINFSLPLEKQTELWEEVDEQTLRDLASLKTSGSTTLPR